MAPLDASIGHPEGGQDHAVGSPPRSARPVVPDIPTLAEQGLTNYSLSLWFGLWGAPNTARTVQN